MRKEVLFVGFIALLLLAACNAVPDINSKTLPEGDAERGETLFHESVDGTASCVSCHLTTDETLIGPGLAGIAERAASRVDGLSAVDYIVDSIVHPANFIVSGYSNLMYAGYGRKLSEQDIADLLAYLLTL